MTFLLGNALCLRRIAYCQENYASFKFTLLNSLPSPPLSMTPCGNNEHSSQTWKNGMVDLSHTEKGVILYRALSLEYVSIPSDNQYAAEGF